MKTDKEIMLEVSKGDLEKLRMIYMRYKIKLYNYFYRLTYNQQASEDLVQDLFVKLIKYAHTYRGVGNFTTWLFSIAHNAYIDNSKKQKKAYDVDDFRDRLFSDDDVHGTVETNDDIRILRTAFQKLPDAERELLTLSKYKRVKYEDIADIMNCSVGTIKSRVHYAIKNLRQEYFELSNEALL